jgi:hypothetical protein
MSEYAAAVQAPDERSYLIATDEACIGVHSLIIIAPTHVGTTENNSHALFEDCAGLSRTFKGRLDGTFHSVGHTSLRFRIVDLVGAHESIIYKVERLEKRHPDTVFCLTESASPHAEQLRLQQLRYVKEHLLKEESARNT